MNALRHAGIVVSDIDVSMAFYRDHFGFQPLADAVESGPALSRQLALPDVEVRTVKLRPAAGGAILELLQFRAPAAIKATPPTLTTVGLTHLALTVDDAARVHRRLCAAGHIVTSPPVASADGGVRMFFCSDPDGVQLEIVEEVAR